jgi:hypothetical protein
MSAYDNPLASRIKGGTISGGGPSLCRTCRHATRRQGERPTDSLTYCHQIESNLRFESYECSDYDDKRQPALWMMEEVAWQFRTDPKQKGQMGFVSPEKLKKLREEGKIDDETPVVGV